MPPELPFKALKRASYFIWLNRRNHHFEGCNLTNTEKREEGRLSAPKTGLTHRRLARSPETSPVIHNGDADDDVRLESSTASTTDDSSKGHMRKLLIPCDLSHQFSRAARSNTNSDIETCGILLGKLIANCLHITHLLIPKQKGTPNSYSAEKEEEVTEYQLSNDLITLGWIHTHPSQTAFLSSIDLHTQCPYQLMMPEAVAIVYAARYKEVGIYHLTPNHGLQIIKNCSQTGFHPHHMDPPLFETAQHTAMDKRSHIKIVDLRSNTTTNSQHHHDVSTYSASKE
jgi:proteasome lid subunit RPN8/RPN11